MSTRCAIYARYSSDQQREASIEDQLRVCGERARREGWEVVDTFSDAAVSGAMLDRPGLQALLGAAAAGKVDIVLAESLDRLSRDQEHIARIFKQVVFAGARLVTLAEGDISELHIGLKGTMGALFLKELADKTRRGLEGRIRAGRSAGTVAYGYRVVRQQRPDGEPERGLREPDPAKAAIVRRIFADYAAGRSPRAIAQALNEEGVSGPGGGPWFGSTIRGRARRGDGVLRNPIYIGQLVWNRKRTVKDPVTGRELRRMNDPANHVMREVPELRLIDEDLWRRVQARLRSDVARTQPRGAPAFWEQRRPRYLLSGKVFCGACGGPFYALGRDYLGCKSARRYLCRNTARVRRAPLEARVLKALRSQLMATDLVAEFVTAFTQEWNRLASEAGQARAAREDALRDVERKIANLIDAIAEGLSPAGLKSKLDALEAQRARLAADLSDPPTVAPGLHPNLAQLYRARVAALEQALGDKGPPDVLEAARGLIDRVVVHPPSDPGGPPGLELIGQFLAMLEAGGAKLSPENPSFAATVLGLFDSSVKAGRGGQRPPRALPQRRPVDAAQRRVDAAGAASFRLLGPLGTKGAVREIEDRTVRYDISRRRRASAAARRGRQCRGA
jgi:DNA invertase Pin-like site-specific DNA recombinase